MNNVTAIFVCGMMIYNVEQTMTNVVKTYFDARGFWIHPLPVSNEEHAAQAARIEKLKSTVNALREEVLYPN